MTRKKQLSINKIIKEIHNRFDYSLPYEKRIEIIEKINQDFGDDLQNYYFYYKTSNLKKYNNKITYDKICSVYDRMSEYILFAEVPKNLKEKLKYSKTDIPYSQESNLKTMQSGDEISFDTYAHLLLKEKGMVRKKYDDQNHAVYTLKYFKEHIKKCPYIEDYIIYNNYARDIIKKLDRQIEQYNKQGIKTKNIKKFIYKNSLGDKTKFTPKQLQTLKRGIGYNKNNSREIDKDIIAILREYFRPIYFKNPLRESERTRKIDLDFMDKEHVSGLIKASCLAGQLNKFDKYVDRLDKLVNTANLTETETKIYNIFRKGKGLNTDDKNIKYEDNMFTISECARTLDMSQSKVDMLFDSLVYKICDKYEELYEDYYFTFIARGTYKKCSKCGEVKLANERYFGWDKTNNRWKSQCKKCILKSKNNWNSIKSQ